MNFRRLPIDVDYFAARPGRTADAAHFFLTHAHADHLHGLTPDTPGPIFCTAQTALVASLRTGTPLSIFQPLAPHVRTRLHSSIHGELHVTLLPTFHCYGACMFFFEGAFGTVLHTGDFRATLQVLDSVKLLAGRVDSLFMDCTYCHPALEHPSLHLACQEVITHISAVRTEQPWADVIIASDTFGKEELFVAVSQHMQEPVMLEPNRYAILARIDPRTACAHFRPICPRTQQPQPISPACDPPSDDCKPAFAQPSSIDLPGIFVLPRWKVSENSLQSWTARTGRPTSVIAVSAYHANRPSASEFRKVAYSSHSSFSELRRFVEAIKPARVAPTLETAGYGAGDGYVRDPQHWFADVLKRRVAVARAAVPSRVCTSAQLSQRMSEISKATGATFARPKPDTG